jgi:hypothetical protein
MRTLARRRATTSLSTTLAVLGLGACALGGCATSRGQTAGEEPKLAEIYELALAARSDPLIRYLIADRVYYYAASGCCDQLNPLFDADGKYVCAPDGGFTGRGDGRCPEELVNIGRSPGTSVANPFYRRR